MTHTHCIATTLSHFLLLCFFTTDVRSNPLTATETDDYTGIALSLEFPINTREMYESINILQDDVLETAEKFTVTISVGADDSRLCQPSTATVTIDEAGGMYYCFVFAQTAPLLESGYKTRL